MNKFIVTADWHIRNTVPRCRLETEEEFVCFQLNLIHEICKEVIKFNADALIIAGDLFDRGNPGINIINAVSTIFQKYPIPVYACAGNHDLPYHSWDLVNDSGYGLLLIDKIINKIVLFGVSINNYECQNYQNQEIVICHHLCFKDKKSMPPNKKAMTAQELLNLYPSAQWIFCGDNHQGFHYEKNGRHIIVPGSIYIEATDQINYEPCIWIVDIEKETVESIKLQNPVEMISTEHVEIEKERNERMDAFAKIIQSKKEKIGLSFKYKLQKKLQNENISDAVKNIIIEIKEECGV